jgi:hypothetical protein
VQSSELSSIDFASMIGGGHLPVVACRNTRLDDVVALHVAVATAGVHYASCSFPLASKGLSRKQATAVPRAHRVVCVALVAQVLSSLSSSRKRKLQ